MKGIAREYLARGWSVLPLRPGSKSPLIPWREYQTRLPRPEEVDQWDWSGGLGIVTGSISGFVVLDVDVNHGGLESLKKELPDVAAKEPTVRTGSGWSHYYYKAPRDGIYRNFSGRLAGVDFRGEGGFGVAPPSLHPRTGNP